MSRMSGRWLWYILFGFAAGSAVAGRINTAPIAGMIFIAGAIQLLPAFDTTISNRERTRTILRVVIGVMLAGIVALITFRVFNPYAFASTSIIPTGLNPRWLANIAEGQFGVSGMQDTPPNWAMDGAGKLLLSTERYVVVGHRPLPLALQRGLGSLGQAYAYSEVVSVPRVTSSYSFGCLGISHGWGVYGS